MSRNRGKGTRKRGEIKPTRNQQPGVGGNERRCLTRMSTGEVGTISRASEGSARPEPELHGVGNVQTNALKNKKN